MPTAAPAELRVGIIGGGFMARVHSAAARQAGARVEAVAASTPARSREVAAELDIDRAFPSADDLINSPDLDVVHICVPNHLHEALALTALGTGKHIVLEKPVATSLEGALRIRAKSQGLVVAVPFVYRFHPMVREARARVRGDDIGDPYLLRGEYLQDWLSQADDYNWRVDPTLSGPSRSFADIGTHLCDIIEFVSGHRIRRVNAMLPTVFSRRFREDGTAGSQDSVRVGTEDAAIVMFESHKGASGSLVISQVTQGRKNRLIFELSGPNGSISFNQEEPETLWIGRRSRTEIIPREPAVLSRDASRMAVVPAGHPQGYTDCFRLFLDDVYRSTKGEEPEGMPGIDAGIRAASITEAVLDSARGRTWVEVAG